MELSKNFIDLDRLTLWARDEDGNNSRLSIGFRDGQPRISIFPAQKLGAGSIYHVPFDAFHMSGFLELMNRVAGNPENSRYRVESKAPEWVNNEPTTNLKLVGALYVGRRKDGCVYIASEAPERPTLVFPFTLSKFHAFLDKEGEDMPIAELSSCLAMGWVRLVQNAVLMANWQWNSENAKPFAMKPRGEKSGGPPKVNLDTEGDDIPY